MGVVPDIVDLINRSTKALRDSERQVAEVVLNDLHFSMTASASELAKRAHVSAASITRFCRALGFANLREFKLCVAQNLAINAHFMSNSVARTDSFGELVRSVTRGLGTAMVDLEQEIDVDRLSAALEIVSDAEHIHVFPIDPEAIGTAIDLFHQLLRLGAQCSYHVPPEEQRMVLSAARPGSAIIILGAEAGNLEASELFESIKLTETPAILMAPPLAASPAFPGVHLEIPSSIAAGLFAQSARRYKLALMVDLICIGSSLDLVINRSERERSDVDQSAPPPKR